MPPPERGDTALQPWSIAGSRYVLRDRWIALRADRCVTAEGATVEPFYVLDYPDWVQVVALDAGDRLLLVRQYRHGAGAIMLELACGGMEAADDGPVAAARRELAEEVGYAGGEWRLVGSFWPNAATHANRAHVVLATGVTRTVEAVAGASERVELVPVPVVEAVRLALAGGLPQQMHVAALAVALTALGRWSG